MRVSDLPGADDGLVSRGHRRKLASTIAVALATAALVAGCGVEGQDLTDATQSSDSTTVTTTQALDPADAIVTPDDVAASDPDSPERTVLEWWRAAQSRDTDGVVDAYTKKVKDDLPEGFKFSVVSLIAPAASTSSISIDSVEYKDEGKSKKDEKSKGGTGNDKSSLQEDANRAILYAMIDSTAPRIAGSLALPMEREDGEWKIADSTFLVAVASALNSEIAAIGSAAQAATTGG